MSDSNFSNEFWIETLPLLYSKTHKLPLSSAKKLLQEKFKEFEKYDYRYYSLKYWLKELKHNYTFDQILKLMKNKPVFLKEYIPLLKKQKKTKKLIIISSTTKEFIDLELGENKKYFDKVYSSIDDFNIAGKPKEVYKIIAKELKLNPNEILHIGDDELMDVKNAKEAGCKAIRVDQLKDSSFNKLVLNY